MRGSIDWFFGAPQESLATQANQHYANAEGRLIGALDRWRRGVENGIEPLKANITECVTFIDFVSAGLNKVVMYDTHGISSPYPHTEYTIYPAWLERNDKGYITKITMNEHVYEFAVDEVGIVTDVRTNIFMVNDDVFSAFENTTNCFDVLKNDSRLEGGRCKLVEFTQPSHGTLRQVGEGKLIYTPDKGYLGSDSFTYTAGFEGAVKTATVTVSVLGSQGAVMETYTGIGGDSILSLTGSTKFPDSPDEIAIQSTFECPPDRMETYGVRMKAWLKPPVTDSYTFWVASDDNGELWLSSDMDPVNALLIASVPGWTDPRQWNKFTEQQSSPVVLDAGKYYYIEALMKEGGGKDNLAVAWQGTNISQQVINGIYLKPFVDLHDGFDGLSDWGWFSSRWMDTDCSDFPKCSGSDLDNDLDVDYWDLMIFFNNWLMLQ